MASREGCILEVVAAKAIQCTRQVQAHAEASNNVSFPESSVAGASTDATSAPATKAGAYNAS
eukprot:10733006-Lingulodinium_polyedra.AAC.1